MVGCTSPGSQSTTDREPPRDPIHSSSSASPPSSYRSIRTPTLTHPFWDVNERHNKNETQHHFSMPLSSLSCVLLFVSPAGRLVVEYCINNRPHPEQCNNARTGFVANAPSCCVVVHSMKMIFNRLLVRGAVPIAHTAGYGIQLCGNK
jgi:hypothetical protein